MNFFLAMFFVSGFCSLVCEVVWLRLAMGAFGVTAPFVSIFLSVFMAGLGLGSWGTGLLCRRLKSKAAAYSLRLYAGTELLIALSAIAVPSLLALGRDFLAGALGNAAWGSSAYYWASGLCTGLAIIPWCVCMGATFPLAMTAIERRFAARSRNSFSYLYLANVVGAGLGTAVSAFVLIELFGFRGTLFFAAALNVMIAVAALALSFSRWISVSADAAPDDALAPNPGLPAPRDTLILLFTTGLVSMAMEVVWTRQFTPYLGNSVYAFAIVLGTYLLASFAGSCFYRARIKKGASQYDGAWILSGALSILPLYAADPYLPINSYARVVLGIVPLCCLLGFLTPSLIDRWSLGNPNRAGTAYAVNVLGCILGPLIAGFWLLPRLAEGVALTILATPLFIAGLLAALRRREGALLAASAGFAAIIIFSSSSFEDRLATWVHGTQVKRDYQASAMAARRGKSLYLMVNGIGMTKITPITKFMAHLPLAFLSRPPGNALVICFGMGTTFRSLLSWGIPATAVELVPSIPQLFGFFHKDAVQLLASPNARVVIDDGRRFLARTKETFDVITIDPAPPMSAAGTSFLYSEEFYAAVKNRLKDDGIMQQWIMEPMEPILVSSFAKAIKDSFPYVRVFRSVEGWGYHCLASRSPIPGYTAAALQARMPVAALKDLLEWGPQHTGIKQLQALLSAEVPIDAIIAPNAEGLRDDHPINEYFFLRNGSIPSTCLLTRPD